MGGRSHFSLFFLVLAFISSAAARLAQVGAKNPIATLQLTNAMPIDSSPVQLRCDSDNTDCGNQELRVGDAYKCGVEEKVVYYCAALSGRQIASIHGFEPTRDGAHKEVFWLVKNDGFYLSWDNSSWVKKEEWFNE